MRLLGRRARSLRTQALTTPMLSAAVAAALVVWAAAFDGQQPTFRSAVDLIAVDVHVVDRDGRPVVGLAPSSFNVTIDRRRRRVVSADLLQYLTPSLSPESSNRAARPTGSNVWPSEAPSRSFVLAIDTASFSAGESAVVAGAARRFVSRLSPNDLIGVHALPRGVVLSPTSDRAQVGRAIASIVGMQAMRPGQFHLTPAEVVDISAADGEMQPTGRPLIGGRAAQTPSPIDQNLTLQQVQLRECRTTTDQTCLASILVEAESSYRQFEEEATEMLAGLEDMLRLLAEYPAARRTVVLISAGIPVSDRQGGWHSDGGQARQLGNSAARANATVYSLHVDRGYSAFYSAEARKPRQDLARERELEEMLLSELANASGGTLLSAPTGAPDTALDRLLLETSAFYLLGVAPDTMDLDGQTHALSVKVAEKGATVRSRQYVLLPKAR